MVLDARELAEGLEEQHPPLTFIGLDGYEYELPNPNMLTSGKAFELNSGMASADEDAVAELLDEIAPDAKDALWEMPAVITAQIMEAWVELIDEEAKPDSSSAPRNRAERRSKKTSQSKASTSGKSPATKKGRPRKA